MLAITLFLLCSGTAFAGSWVRQGLQETKTYDMRRAEHLFEKFIVDHNKYYPSNYEKQWRFKVFKENLHEINNYNRKHHSSVMGINHFTDMTKEEFKTTRLGYTIPTEGGNCSQLRINSRLHRRTPDSFDWRDHGVVTPVKNQGDCGSCWAFSAIANIESQHALKHNEQLDLAEQQEVDCDQSNKGCEGGWPSNAITNLIHLGGLMSEDDYPYIAQDGQCIFDPTKIQVKVTNCFDFTGSEEESIKDLLVTYGPLTIALGGGPMQHYDKGILTTCDSEINHALLVVGYGTDPQTNTPYWIIKNSWGDWGENGYLRLARGNPQCAFGQYGLTTAQVA